MYKIIRQWIMQHIVYKSMKKRLDRKLIELGGFRGEANELYGLMWDHACCGWFSEEQKQELLQAVPYRGPKAPR